MATTLNMVTVGNDFVLRVKVGMVQYSNNSVQWDYMDLTTCRNIVFNISCTKHDIDINLPYTIDQTDHAVISATVRAEMLHANSIYNFSITGIDSEGYRWTYISPKQQSFITTNVSQDSANAYTELAFTAGMIMPLAAQGKNGFTPYIGPNNNWWINGEDTGVSAIADIDLSDYATKEYVNGAIENIPVVDLTSYATISYVSEAINNIDIPQVDLTGYATISYVSEAINNIDIPQVDLTSYATKAYVTYAIENIDIPEVDLTGYATEQYVTNQINNIDIGGSAISACGALIDKTNIINSMLNANGDTSQFMNSDFIDFDNATRNNGYNREIILYNGSIVEAVKIGEEETPFDTENHVDIIRLRFYSRAEQCYKEIVYGMDMADHGNPFHYYMTSLEVSSFEYLTNANAGGYIDTWAPVNQIYEHYDCSQSIDKILNGDTITTGWDIQNLWEVTFNHDARKAQPVYKNSPISWYIDKDDNNQTLKTYYRFWNRDDGLYYNVTVQWTYLGDDTSSALLEQSILSTTFTTEEYATTAYVTAAVSGISPSSPVDLTSYATKSYVTYAIENIDFTPYVTNSYLTSYYSTTDDILTEVDTTISDVTTVEGEQWVKHDYQLMRYECNRIRFYDYLYSNSQAATCYGFKIGIVNEENVDLYNITANSTYDDEIEIHTWYRMIPYVIQGEPIHYEYIYDNTSVESDNSIRYNYSIQDGEDEFGHYIDITLIDDGNDGIVYFGPKVSDVTKGSNYTNEIDGQTITITNSSGSSLIIPTIEMVERGYLLDFVYGSIAGAKNIDAWLSQQWVRNEIASYTNSQLGNLKFEVITESNYNTALSNNQLDNNTLYIVL